MAKVVAKIFRGDQQKPVETATKTVVILGPNQAKRATIEALVLVYNPDDSSDIIHSELTRRMGGNKPCVVFDQTGKVDIDATVRLINEIVVDKLEPRNNYNLNGVPVPVYRIGENPMRMYDEDPLFPGKRLRSDGSSDQVPFSWQPIPLAIRQLARIALETGDADPKKAVYVVDLVEKFKDDLDALRRRWPAASIKFAELESTGQLPTLKIRMGNKVSSSGQTGPKSPFSIEKEGNRAF